MRPVSSTEMPPLSFNVAEGETSKRFRLPTGQIGWIHGTSDQAGAKFDLTIKDALGRTILERKDYGNETDKFGEALNLKMRMGEEVEIVIENVRGAKKLDFFVN